jgi:hypothetical protein
MEAIQKSTKSDLTPKDPKCFFDPFGENCNQLRIQKEKEQKRINIGQQRIKIQKQIVNNQRQEKFLCRWTLILTLFSLGFVLDSNKQVQKTGLALAGTAFMANSAIVFFHSNNEKRLRKKESFWIKKANELERS